MAAGRTTFKKGEKVSRIERKLGNPSAALKQIGALMVSESQRAFKLQEFGGKRWDPRAPVNVFGIIADFHAGKRKPPARRFEPRPALRDTGRLASSIAFRVVGDTVEVGSNLPYASVHQTGGEVESKPITQTVRTNLWAWLKKQSKDLKRRIGWVLNPKFKDKTIKGEVPARPFVGITKQTREFVREAVGVSIMEVE